jgi:hypothetical protein
MALNSTISQTIYVYKSTRSMDMEHIENCTIGINTFPNGSRGVPHASLETQRQLDLYIVMISEMTNLPNDGPLAFLGVDPADCWCRLEHDLRHDP